MKVSIVRPLALAGSLACIAAFQAIPAAAQDYGFQEHKFPQLSEPSQQSAKTRDDVRSEYLQAVKEGTQPISPESNATQSAAAPAISSLTRQAVLADTIEWLRLQHGDVQMGGQ